MLKNINIRHTKKSEFKSKGLAVIPTATCWLFTFFPYMVVRQPRTITLMACSKLSTFLLTWLPIIPASILGSIISMADMASNKPNLSTQKNTCLYFCLQSLINIWPCWVIWTIKSIYEQTDEEYVNTLCTQIYLKSCLRPTIGGSFHFCHLGRSTVLFFFF